MDLVSQTVGGTSDNPMQVGLGVVTGSISPVFSQGAIENTREATNVAIQGNGFFVVRGDDRRCHTRAPATSASMTTARWSRPTATRCRATPQLDPATGEIITTGEPTDIIVPPGVLRAPVATSTFRDADQPRRHRRCRRHVHHVGADLRLARRAARDDDDLHARRRDRRWDYAITVARRRGRAAPPPATPFVLGSRHRSTFDAHRAGRSVTPTAPATGGGDRRATRADHRHQFTTPTWANGAAASTLDLGHRRPEQRRCRSPASPRRRRPRR